MTREEKDKLLDICNRLDGIASSLEQELCEDAISRQAVLDLPRIKTHNVWGNVIKESVDVEDIRRLSSVNLQEPKTDTLDRIKAEIEQYLFENEFGSAYRKEIAQIIDKYKAETE